MQRRIVCAATRLPSGLILCGARHCDSLMRRQMQHARETYNPTEEGFVDQFGEFLTREAAWEVASMAGQIIRLVDGIQGRLWSENLY